MVHSRSSSPKPIGTIDVTAFSSVMAVVLLTLLIIEMVAFPTPYHHGGMDLPKVNHPVGMWAANREDAIIVSVIRDGKVFFGNERVEPEQLPSMIKERLAQDAERKVYIKADARVRFGRVSQVLDAIRSAGVLRIAFFVDQRKSWQAQ